MISFPKLGERTVKIQAAGGEIFEVRKLGIDAYAKIEAVLDETAKTCKPLPLEEQAQPILNAKKAIIELIAPCLPEKLQSDLWRFGYYDLVEFAMYLAFGSEQPAPAESKSGDSKKKAAKM